MEEKETKFKYRNEGNVKSQERKVAAPSLPRAQEKIEEAISNS